MLNIGGSIASCIRPYHWRRLAQNIGGAWSGLSAITDDIIGLSGATLYINSYRNFKKVQIFKTNFVLS